MAVWAAKLLQLIDYLKEEPAMIKVLLTVLTSAAIGLIAASGVSAAPMDGGAMSKACATMDSVTHVQHWRWGSGGHWRWGSGGHWRWGSSGGCVRRCNPWRCWTRCY